MFLRFLKGPHFRKLLTESERSERFYTGKFLKIIEHASYSIKYGKISLLYTQGAVASQTPGVFFDSPGSRHFCGVPAFEYLQICILSWNHKHLRFSETSIPARVTLFGVSI